MKKTILPLALLCALSFIPYRTNAQEIIPYSESRNLVTLEDSLRNETLSRYIDEGTFPYTISLFGDAYNNGPVGNLEIITKGRKSLELNLDVGLPPIKSFFNFLRTGDFNYKKTVSFFYENDSTYIERIDEGTRKQETYRYGLKAGEWVLESYDGRRNLNKEKLMGDVLHGEPFVGLLGKKYSGQIIDYNEIKTFLLGLKYRLKVKDEGFEELSFDASASQLFEEGNWKSFARDPDIIFGDIIVNSKGNVFTGAFAKMSAGETLRIYLNGFRE